MDYVRRFGQKSFFVNFSELFLTKVQETIRSLFLYVCATTFKTTIGEQVVWENNSKVWRKKILFLPLTACNAQVNIQITFHTALVLKFDIFNLLIYFWIGGDQLWIRFSPSYESV